jgi:hypothetical protein
MLENTVVTISEMLSYAIRAVLLKDRSSEYVRIEPYLSRAKGLFHSFYPDKDIAEIGVSEDRVRQLPPAPPAPTQPQPGPTVPETPPKTPEPPKQAHHPKKPDIPKPKSVVPPAPKIRYAVPGDGELARTYNQSFLDEIAQVGFPIAAHQGEGVFSCSKELLLNSGSGDSESFIIKLTAPDGRLIYSKAETITKENVDQAARATARKFLEQLKK